MTSSQGHGGIPAALGALPGAQAFPVVSPARSRDAGTVLIVGNFLHAATGTFGVCEGLAVELEGSGWRVLTTSHRPERFKRLADMLGTIWRARSAYDVAQVDVYSGSAFFLAEAACWALRRVHRPYVLTLHGGNLPKFGARYPARVRRLLQSAAAVTTPSGYLRAEMSRYRADLILLPNPLPVSAYRFRLRTSVRPRLIWVRAFHDIYNPIMAIRAVAQLRDDFPDVQLVMVGPDRGDGTREKAMNAAHQLEVERHIEFRGPVPKPQLPDVFDESDIFLNTSSVDNTPVTVVEAMASGLCVISTSVGGIPYMLTHEHDALLVGPNAAPAMAAAVRRLLGSPPLAQQLSAQGRNNAMARDWSLLLPEWNRLLTRVMKTAR